MSLRIKKDIRWVWIALGVVAIILRWALHASPELIEAYYSRGLFPLIRQVFDHSLGLLPFPLFVPLLIIVLLWVGRSIIRLFRQALPWRQKGLQFLFSTAAFLSALVFFFLLLWGFNYGRLSVEKQLGLETRALTYEELRTTIDEETQFLESSRKAIPQSNTTALSSFHLPQDLSTQIRILVKKTLGQLGYPPEGAAVARLLHPRGILLRISTAGFYLPFTGECNIDAGLHPIQMPFVMAHEFAHGFGIADEGACNFIAYLACRQSADPFVRYSGHFGYWRYLRSSFYRQNPEEYQAYKKTLSPGILADLVSVKENSDKYPDLLPKVRDYTYDAYLKAQGVNDGLKSYSRVVLLVHAWNKMQGSTF